MKGYVFGASGDGNGKLACRFELALQHSRGKIAEVALVIESSGKRKCRNLNVVNEQGDDPDSPSRFLRGGYQADRETLPESHERASSLGKNFVKEADISKGEWCERERIGYFRLNGRLQSEEGLSGGKVGHDELVAFLINGLDEVIKMVFEVQGEGHPDAEVFVWLIWTEYRYPFPIKGSQVESLVKEPSLVCNSRGKRGEVISVEDTCGCTLFCIDGEASPFAVKEDFFKLVLQALWVIGQGQEIVRKGRARESEVIGVGQEGIAGASNSRGISMSAYPEPSEEWFHI